MIKSYELTRFSKAGGCGCKLAPSDLDDLISDLFPNANNNGVLVGNVDNDDAVAYDLNEDHALIFSNDFFSPIVDDPYLFGSIASANAISDIYAMGGRPIVAVSIFGWPEDQIPITVAKDVLKGALEKCREAGIQLAGGHTIRNPQPIFGLAVNGLIRKKYIRRNNMASPNDLIFLSKPLGVGILSTAGKKGILHDRDLEIGINFMAQLNIIGAKLALLESVSTMTDVTGFGLLGHLLEICKASKLDAKLDLNKIPVIDGVYDYIKEGVSTSGGRRNWASYRKYVNPIDPVSKIILSDPQTNGGLLIFVKVRQQNEFREFLRKENLESNIVEIGNLMNQSLQEFTITCNSLK